MSRDKPEKGKNIEDALSSIDSLLDTASGIQPDDSSEKPDTGPPVKPAKKVVKRPARARQAPKPKTAPVSRPQRKKSTTAPKAPETGQPSSDSKKTRADGSVRKTVKNRSGAGVTAPGDAGSRKQSGPLPESKAQPGHTTRKTLKKRPETKDTVPEDAGSRKQAGPLPESQAQARRTARKTLKKRPETKAAAPEDAGSRKQPGPMPESRTQTGRSAKKTLENRPESKDTAPEDAGSRNQAGPMPERRTQTGRSAKKTLENRPETKASAPEDAGSRNQPGPIPESRTQVEPDPSGSAERSQADSSVPDHEPDADSSGSLSFTTIDDDLSHSKRELPVLEDIVTIEELALIGSGKEPPKKVLTEAFKRQSLTDKLIRILEKQLSDYNISKLEYKYLRKLFDELLEEEKNKR